MAPNISRTWQQRFFSLVELLFVIVVIMIMVSMIGFQLFKARKKAYRTECKNHLKQIGLAIALYYEDYKVFPSLNGGEGNTNFEPLNITGILANGPTYGCPESKNMKTTAADSNYIYEGSGTSRNWGGANGSSIAIAWDQRDNHEENKYFNILFLDIRIEEAKPTDRVRGVVPGVIFGAAADSTAWE